MASVPPVSQLDSSREWTRAWLARIAERFDDAPARDVLRWGLDSFAPEIALATSFGPQTIVLMDWLAELAPETTIFYLDTGVLFPETLELRDRLARRLGVTFTRVSPDLSLDRQARLHGDKLWESRPDTCCALRKVEPLRRFLDGKLAWITGLRRSQHTGRAGVRAVEWDDRHGLVKLNPLAGWTDRRVWARIAERGLPYNRLHDRGYPSIGCLPCTRPVLEGEEPRAGRWAGSGKTECGIHLPRGGGC